MYFSDIPDAIRMTYFLILLMMYMRAIIQRAVLSTATAICRLANRVPYMSPSWVWVLLLSAVSAERWPAGRVVWWLLFTVLPPLFSSMNLTMLGFWSFGLNGLLLFDFVRLCAGEVVCSFEGWPLVLDRAGTMIDVDVIVPLRIMDWLSSAADL